MCCCTFGLPRVTGSVSAFDASVRDQEGGTGIVRRDRGARLRYLERSADKWTRLLSRFCRRHDAEPGRQFHAFRFRHCRSDLLQQFETFIGKGVGPPAHLLLDVVLALNIAQVEPDLSELLDFVRCEAYRVA